eukprot:CAMPEP_0177668372 /NCGR_PEP_ID=MMETSP0447-20121125/22723_1 /TAXON_ID=0 /ORGANISM="Stygamoeba regulata, Strain BSH-02190019" /LENGTH=83 /DNA_ID=CAMNT_0019174869 /DNA_START=441 /DNA_END=692 /DNA_ORIENTATION=+
MMSQHGPERASFRVSTHARSASATKRLQSHSGVENVHVSVHVEERVNRQGALFQEFKSQRRAAPVRAGAVLWKYVVVKRVPLL